MEKVINLAGHSIEIKKTNKPPITREETARMLKAFERYRNAKEKLDREVIENENWFKGNHWQYISGQNPEAASFKPSGTYLLNGIWHRHAEAMENYPKPVLFERERSDRKNAQLLSQVLPLILKKSNFYSTYSDIWWYKLKQGSGVYGVFWDKNEENGLGDISVKKIDLLRFYPEPYISNLQDSRYVFVLSLCSLDEANRRYPDLRLKNGGNLSVKSYFGSEDISDKAVIIDCYERLTVNGRKVLHLTKIIGDTAVYSTKTDPLYMEKGLYNHGLYPFVIDTMIPVEGSPFGMGIIDIGKNAQAQIDKLEYLIERNALISSRQRFLVKRDGGIDPEKLSDLSVDFIECDRNVDDSSIRPIQASPISDTVIKCRENKIEELKEIIGNRDVSQGATQRGVTAYAAIAALQRAGSKLTRDAIDSSYRSFSEIIYMIIELISQFYTEKRYFRIVGKNAEPGYLTLGGGETFSAAVFDIEVEAQKKSSFEDVSHNELILELYKGGAFSEENRTITKNVIEAMAIENKQSILSALE